MKTKSYSLRIDPTLLTMLRKIAVYENRSINRQIVFILQQYVVSFQKMHSETEG